MLTLCRFIKVWNLIKESILFWFIPFGGWLYLKYLIFISKFNFSPFKGLDISSNKISTEEMEGIPHHLLGFLEPTNSNYNVQNFRNDALNILNKIWSEQKLPILVGGTAYYIESVIFDNNLIATGDREKGGLF